MKATRMMVLTAALLVAACGGDSNGGTGPGNGGTPGFSADVTGDLQASFGGNAGYGVVDQEGGKVFAVEMAESDQTGGGVIQLYRVGGAVPAPGTYQLTDAIDGNAQDGDWLAMAYDTDQGQLTAIFAARSGSVTITSVKNGIAKGTFSFNAEGGVLSDPETTLSVKVSGSFTAEDMTGNAAFADRAAGAALRSHGSTEQRVRH